VLVKSRLCKIVQNRTRSDAQIRTKSAPSVHCTFKADEKFRAIGSRLKPSEASLEYIRHCHLFGLQSAVYTPPLNSSVL